MTKGTILTPDPSLGPRSRTFSKLHKEKKAISEVEQVGMLEQVRMSAFVYLYVYLYLYCVLCELASRSCCGMLWEAVGWMVDCVLGCLFRTP